MENTHSKSKSYKIQIKEESKSDIFNNKTTNNFDCNNSTIDKPIDSTKENLDLNSIINGDNLNKISNLLYDQDNVDEDLYSEDKNTKNNKIKANHQTGDNSDLIFENTNDINNSNPIINISTLEFPAYQNELLNNSNKNDNKENKNEIGIKKNDSDEIFKNKNQNILNKNPLSLKILITILFLIIFALLVLFIYCILTFHK